MKHHIFGSHILFLVAITVLLHGGNSQTVDPCAGFTNTLNSLREAVAKGRPGYGALPGSQAMFALVCDANLAQIAALSIQQCRRNDTLPGEGMSINYYSSLQAFRPLSYAELVVSAINAWRTPAVLFGLSIGANYTDQRLETFANMVFYKSVRFGCAVNSCAASGVVPALQAAACVFNSAPVRNRPLYMSSTTLGCTSDKECDNVLHGSTCGTIVIPPEGLCFSNGANFPSAADSSSTAPTAPSGGAPTQ